MDTEISEGRLTKLLYVLGLGENSSQMSEMPVRFVPQIRNGPRARFVRRPEENPVQVSPENRCSFDSLTAE